MKALHCAVLREVLLGQMTNKATKVVCQKNHRPGDLVIRLCDRLVVTPMDIARGVSAFSGHVSASPRWGSQIAWKGSKPGFLWCSTGSRRKKTFFSQRKLSSLKKRTMVVSQIWACSLRFYFTHSSKGYIYTLHKTL